MASTSGVGSTYMGTDYEEYQNNERVRKTQLGKNDFLNLLAAQMKYQNPLEPMSDTDFIAQLAQFSSLEQMEAMSTAMIGMQAFNLVGKLVQATNVLCDDGMTRDLFGYVETVIHRDGSYYAKVGDYFVAVSKITDVFDKNSIDPENPVLKYANLIGNTVKANAVDEKGNTLYEKGDPILDENGDPKLDEKGEPTFKQGPPITVSGVVSGIGIENDTVVAYLKGADGTECFVPVGNILDIRPTSSSNNDDLRALLESVLAGQNSGGSPTVTGSNDDDGDGDDDGIDTDNTSDNDDTVHGDPPPAGDDEPPPTDDGDTDI